MSIAPTLQKYLDQKVSYETLTHAPTMTSMHTAEACHIPGDRLAKAVVLRHDRGHMLAVLPASHHLSLADLRAQVGEVDIASEDEFAPLFRDCTRGAIPPIGECYGLDVIVDDSLAQQPDVYLEGGDHATLIHLDRQEFAELTRDAQHGRFSRHD
jgi:Ala-tRNA(Pro) deacylase